MIWLRSHKSAFLPAVLAGLVLPGAAWAQDGRIDVADSGDTAWLLAASVLALLSVPGLMLFYGGRARAGNAVSIALQIAAVAAVISLLWIVTGYTLAFGDKTSGYIGSGSAWMLIQLGNVRAGTAVPESAFAFFQLTFALLAPALMTGAWLGRARFGWVVAFCGMWSLIVYAPVAHWIWGGGWLASSVRTLDWSGGLVVHTSAGVSALVAVLLIGPHRDRAQGAMTPQGPLPALAGAMLLWIGSLAQASGYALTASDDAAAALISTHASAAAGALVWLLFDRIANKRTTATGLATGAIAGLASIAASAGYVSPGGAILIGALGSLASRFVLGFFRDMLGIDDSLGVFAVHGVGGVLGTILLGLFMAGTFGGVGYDAGSSAVAQLVAQGIGAGVVIVWSAIGTAILAITASFFVSMRVSEEAEQAGLDSALHSED